MISSAIAIFAHVIPCIALLVQPGCSPSEQTETFYNLYANSSTDFLQNWVCHENFEQKLKICGAMFMAINKRPFTTAYKVVRDSETVLRKCQRQNVSFVKYEVPPVTFAIRAHFPNFLNYDENEGSEVSSEIKYESVTLDVNLFKCPITKMDLKFVRSWSPIDIFDLYIVTGRDDVNVIVLRDSTMPDTENICVVDMYFYTGGEDIEYKGLYNKP